MSLDIRNAIAAEAEKLIGVSYLHQGRDPKYGLDCVGVPAWICGQLGMRCDDPGRYRRTATLGSFLKHFRSSGCESMRYEEAHHGDIIILRLGVYPMHCGVLVKGRRDEMIHSFMVPGAGGSVRKDVIDHGIRKQVLCAMTFPGVPKWS